MTLKDDVLRFRVNSKEKEAIEQAAERDGLSTSTWLRRLALREAGWLTAQGRVASSLRLEGLYGKDWTREMRKIIRELDKPARVLPTSRAPKARHGR